VIRIEFQAWERMLSHAVSAYPEECCGALLGLREQGGQAVTLAVPLENAAAGPKGSRYEIRPGDLLKMEQLAESQELTSIGIYHSHPDCDAYFSETDLKNSCPWYSFVVLSIRGGQFSHARCFRPDADQTEAEPEPLSLPNGDGNQWPRS
jgi:proteasome lid subunit RPN8/RPN11